MGTFRHPMAIIHIRMPVTSRSSDSAWRPGLTARRTTAIWVIILCLAGCQPHSLVPTPNLYVNTAQDPFADVPPAWQSSRIELIYVTDRGPDQKSHRLDYGFERSSSMGFGLCTVRIGKNVDWSTLVRESRSRKRRRPLKLEVAEATELARYAPTPVPLVRNDGVLTENTEAAQADAEIDALLLKTLRDQLLVTPRREVYLYVHGYKNTFERAAFRIAQIWHFLGRQGVPLLYSWPAGYPTLLGYGYDRESGEFTIFHLKRILKVLASCPELERIHVIAHSRGADVFMTALRELHLRYGGSWLDTRTHLKLGNVVLAAADLDMEVVGQRISAERIHLVPERLTIYLSDEDKAISFADWLLNSVQRLGLLTYEFLSPQEKEAVQSMREAQFIDTRVTTDFLGHTYFLSNPAVLSDLILVLRDNRDPGREHGRPLIERQYNFWELHDDYPTINNN